MDEANALIGQRLRKIRKQKKLTLKEVSAKLECSSPFLSMFENGRTGISYAKLQRLLAIYGMTMADLAEDDHVDRVVTLDTAIQLGNGRTTDGVESLLLARCPQEKQMEPILFRLQPGAILGPMQHPGEEFCHVIEGNFEVTLLNQAAGTREVYYLKTGDTIYYDSTIPHIWRNTSSDKVGIFLGTVTPASF